MRLRPNLKPAIKITKKPNVVQPPKAVQPKVEPALPPKREMLKNVTKSVMKNLTGIINGEGAVLSKEEANKRLGICNQCEFFRYSDQRCGKCGCMLSFKTYLKAEKCPVGKW